MIKVLDKDVADKIAAGEVIERPASIVKELVENSIDAGSTSITVDIRNGGKTYIRVSDNGCGIGKKDVEKAFLRHATSKISSAKDLDSIHTLGFRGEALASICAVTRTQLITKQRDDKGGTSIKIHGSNTVSIGEIGCQDGTTIIVEDLFYNTPAREKFLKTSAVEAGQIIDLVSNLAITLPTVRFSLISSGKPVFTTMGSGNLKNTILEVYQEKSFRELIPLDYKDEKIKIYGYISKPDLSRKNRRDQHFFVNGRLIKSKVLEKGIMEGYRERLFENQYPICFVFIQIDPSSLDVNIHPNKKEVRFDEENLVIESMRKAVLTALSAENAVPKVDEPKLVSTDYIEEEEKKGIEEEKEGNMGFSNFFQDSQDSIEEKKTTENDSYAQVEIDEILSQKREEEKIEISNSLDDEAIIFNLGNTGKPSTMSCNVKEERTDYIPIKSPNLKPFDFNKLVYKEILFGTYIIATDDSSMYIIDQHAAHERIFYEKLLNQYNQGDKHSQVLMLPFTFDVPKSLLEDKNWQGILFNMGYQLSLFGSNTFLVREIPEFMTISEGETFVNLFIDQYVEGEEIKNQVVIDKIIMKSCKSAIKAHDYIKEEEAKALIQSLKVCRNPFSCPHGRPTFIKFSLYEIEKMFRRV